jgi:hypothetical protein
MASGGEPFRLPLHQGPSGSWLDATGYRSAITQPAKIAYDPSKNPPNGGGNTATAVTRSVVAAPEGQSAFAAQIRLNQWYTFTFGLTQPFDEGQSVTIVWTRGTAGQSALLEWTEADGSRWMYAFALTAEWTKHVLASTDFKYFADGSPPGRASSAFIPGNARRFVFGVQSGPVTAGSTIEMAIGPVGVAAPSAAGLETFTPPVIETLLPAYKQYTTTLNGRFVRMPVARPRGIIASGDAPGRYIAFGNLLAPSASAFITPNGGLTVWLPWPELPDGDRQQLIAFLKGSAFRQVSFLSAGPQQVVYLPQESLLLGGKLLNFGKNPARGVVDWSVLRSGVAVTSRQSIADLAPGETRLLPVVDVGTLPPAEYIVQARLMLDGAEADRIDSRVRVMDPLSSRQPDQRITAKDGAFYAGGKRVYLHGINFWPRYVTGVEGDNSINTKNWLQQERYDPEAVQADLDLVASMKYNLVTVQLWDRAERGMMDFLERCRARGIWAFIFSQPTATPEFWLLPDALDRIRNAYLPGNDRVFAHELAWEPHMGTPASRARLDEAWRTWIADQYGSVQNAEKSWAFAAPRNSTGQVTNPPDAQLTTDGPHRTMVAAFRRFWDDYGSRALGVAARAIRRLDPEALLEFRNGYGGNFTQLANTMMAFDLGVGAAHVDFIGPETYGIPAWPAGRSWGLAAPYSRYRSAGKPVYFAEFGQSIGPNGGTPSTRLQQLNQIEATLNVINDEGAAGGAVWWLAGGWRYDEQSDYGIFNPDGSPRESALVMQKWGTQFAAKPPDPPSGDPAVITFDRDADARGLYGVFQRHQTAYVQARQSSRPVVLREEATGSDTASLLLKLIGNAPYADGGPLKYANAEFGGFRIQCGTSDVVAENGATVQIPVVSPCQITATLINTGQAAWLAGSQASGGVTLKTTAGDVALPAPLSYLQRTELGPLRAGSGNITITGRLTIAHPITPIGIPFGETLRLTIQRRLQ